MLTHPFHSPPPRPPPPAPLDQVAPSAQPSFQEVADLKTREYLNDLSSRRRVTTLFPNRQSARWGVQENMVNTTKGNLTFLVRDLVRIDLMPIMFGRVYDSSLRAGDDFGPGWRLAVDERIVRRGSRLLYTDATGTTHRLRLRGDRIAPAVLALTPIRSGVLLTGSGGRVIVLQSDDLLRRFEKIGNAYRLVAVSHDRGSLRLSYQDERLAVIASNAGTLQIKRRPDGRIIAVQDDHGREVSYAYDAAGRLHKAIDRAGGIWEYRYRSNRSGQLIAIIDPRLVTILEATHHDGRVEWVRALRRETTFTYERTNTRAVDVLGRVKVFHHHGRSGITDGIEDASGAFTQIIFNDDYRPVEMMRNGEAVARMQYDEEGRLASLWRPGGETTYLHGGKGLISAEGASKARYRYDDAGRVIQASDERGERTYTYDGNGGLASVTTDGIELQFSTNAAGVITDVRHGDEPLISHVIAGDGRVASTVYGHGESSLAVSHRYNERGLREESIFADGIVARMGYDDVGNLIHYKVTAPNGGSKSQAYEINAFNEVQRIKTDGPGGPGGVSFRYDEAGRVFELQSGSRGATVEHDALDRVTRVTLDGEELLTYDYAATDMDVVAAWDVLSMEVPVPFGTSSVFGPVESIAYARLRPMDYGPISHAPVAGTFRVETAHLAPDAVLQSSLERRMMPLRGEPLNGASFGYDKPSNSLFIPPEYFSVNCHVCTEFLYSILILVRDVILGEAADITIRVSGDCYETISEEDVEDDRSPFDEILEFPYDHTISLGDGTVVQRSTSRFSTRVRLSYRYQSPGTYTILDQVSCGCGSLFTLGRASKRVEVESNNGSGRGPLVCRNPITSRDYDSRTGCCTLRAATPFSLCNRQEQIEPILVNGCSPPATPYMMQTFESACNQHDRCYGTCSMEFGHKSTCDGILGGSAEDRCDEILDFVQDFSPLANLVNRAVWAYCISQKEAMVTGVTLGGWYNYGAAQREYCRCC